MRIGPELLALRSDPASQRLAQAALEAARDAWRASESVMAMLAELESYGEGALLEDCPSLSALFEGEGVAVVAALVGAMIHGLRAHPLGQVPLRHQFDRGIGALQLAQSGNATLSLLAYEESAGAEVGPDSTLCFSDGERHELVLAGKADLQIMRMTEDCGAAAKIDGTPRRVVAGEVLHFREFDQTKLVELVHGRLILLRLARTMPTPKPSHEYRLSDGALVHRASGDRRESRYELTMALLGRMRRHDAAPVFAEMTREGSEHLRWQALRECLALDAARGFAALCVLASDQVDPLSAPAAALRAQLLETHPQLADLEHKPCLV